MGGRALGEESGNLSGWLIGDELPPSRPSGIEEEKGTASPSPSLRCHSGAPSGRDIELDLVVATNLGKCIMIKREHILS